MGHRLSEFADVHIGYKSLLNDFFYVDVARIERFGIEPEYLTPIFKLADLDDDRYSQTGLAPTRWLFNCRLEPNDLRGTGAGKYVRWGRSQSTRPRKQTEKPVPWPDAPALSNARHWYWPAATPHVTKIAIRKAIGQRYAPFLFEPAQLLDQRLYIVLPKGGLDWRLIAAYLSSSLFPLSLEVGANLSLGVGYLTLGTHALRRLPCFDLAQIAGASESADPILEAAEALFDSQPPDAEAYPDNSLIEALDSALLRAAGLPDDRAQRLASEVARFAQVRRSLELLKEQAPEAQSSADIGAVADDIAKEIEPWLDARRFPDDYMRNGERLALSFPDSHLTARAEPMLGTCQLRIETDDGQTQLDLELPVSAAEVIVRALQLGRHQFETPLEDEAAHAVLDGLERMLAEFEERFQHALSRTSIGPKYESQVRAQVLRKVSVPLSELRRTFGYGEWQIDRSGLLSRH